MSNPTEQATANEIAKAASLLNPKISASAFVERRWQNVRHLKLACRANKKVILLAILQEGRAIRYATKALRKDYDLVLRAVRNNGLALEYASSELQNNKALVLEAVASNGTSLQYASIEMKRDKDVVMAAVEENMLALMHVDHEHMEKLHPTFVTDVVQQSVRSIWHGNHHVDYGEGPDFRKFSSMDHLEYYAESVFGEKNGENHKHVVHVPVLQHNVEEEKEGEAEDLSSMMVEEEDDDDDGEMTPFMREMRKKYAELIAEEKNDDDDDDGQRSIS